MACNSDILIYLLTLFLTLPGLQERFPKISAGSWFQSWMVITEIVSGCEMDSSGSKRGTVAASCEHDSDPTAPTEGRARDYIQTDC
jgi:hypothetical protein